jgi:hypothetical protein
MHSSPSLRILSLTGAQHSIAKGARHRPSDKERLGPARCTRLQSTSGRPAAPGYRQRAAGPLHPATVNERPARCTRLQSTSGRPAAPGCSQRAAGPLHPATVGLRPVMARNTHTRPPARPQTHTRTHARARARTHTHAHTRTQTRTHANKNTNTRARTHTGREPVTHRRAAVTVCARSWQRAPAPAATPGTATDLWTRAFAVGLGAACQWGRRGPGQSGRTSALVSSGPLWRTD